MRRSLRRGCRAGSIPVRFRKRENRPPLLSILLTNMQSFQWQTRNCSVICLTETGYWTILYVPSGQFKWAIMKKQRWQHGVTRPGSLRNLAWVPASHVPSTAEPPLKVVMYNGHFIYNHKCPGIGQENHQHPRYTNNKLFQLLPYGKCYLRLGASLMPLECCCQCVSRCHSCTSYTCIISSHLEIDLFKMTIARLAITYCVVAVGVECTKIWKGCSKESECHVNECFGVYCLLLFEFGSLKYPSVMPLKVFFKKRQIPTSTHYN